MSLSSSSSSLEDQVKAVIQSLEDKSLSRAYFRALEIVPELVARESRIVDYLHIEQGNVQAAALRLVRYWDFRRHIFGEERWLLPMTQVSDMEQCFLCEYTRQGRTYLWHGTNRIAPNLTKLEHLFINFHFFSDRIWSSKFQSSAIHPIRSLDAAL